MMRLRGAPLLVLLLAACSDDPVGPELASSVVIFSGSDRFDEQTLSVGGTIRLTASARDAGGREIAGRAVEWRSSDPAVAEVEADGSVTGVGPGTALVVVTADTRADTARINVAAPVTGDVSCAGRPGLSLEVGEMHATHGWEVGTLCLPGGAAGAEYTLIPFHSSASEGELAVMLDAVGALPTGGLPSTTLLQAEEAAPPSDGGFHLRLRQRARSALDGRLREISGSAGPWLRPAFSRSAAVPATGDRIRLNVETFSVDGCSDPDYRTGRVVAVTERAIVVADTANPAGGFSDAEYQAFGTAFDEKVYPLGVETFGEPSDLDGNGRAVIFFTSAVNELTAPGSGSYVGGFFYDRDLFPRSGSGACAGSNAAEMFYMMVPDAARAANEPSFSRSSVAGHTVGVLAHEFQHLINASRRLHVQRADVWEETWLNEGLSHVAEELLFYRESGLQPGGNEDGSRTATGAAGRALYDHQIQNLERYTRFLRSAQTASPIVGEDLATRGAAWALLRYMADRSGGDQREVWHRLANSGSAGVANLRLVFGVDPLEWVHDWALAVYLDDTGRTTDPRYLQPSWNFRRLLPRLSGFPSRYPLRTLRFESDQRLGLTLTGGAAAYVRLAAAPGGEAAVRFTSGGLPAPSKLRITVVRTR